MGTISEKLVYLNGTKQAIKNAINEDFEVVYDKGKNLWGEEEHGGIDESTGQDIYNAQRWRTIGYINVTPNTSYTISSNASSNIWNIFYYYDINKTFIRSQAINGKEVSATTPSNCFYMRCVIADTATIKTTQRQLEKGSTATDYEPYVEETTFREYADKISSNNAKYKDLIPKETTNATNTLDISNSSGLDKALVTQYGNTYQETTTGKNLYYISPQTKNGVTLNYDSDGAIVLSGTSTGSFVALTQDVSLNGTFTLSTNNAITQANVFVRTRDLNGILLHSIPLDSTSGSVTKTGGISKFEITIGSAGIVFDNFKIYAQLEQGSTATSYEKYSGGNPAPSPDYPQAITNVTGTNTIKINGKNLWGEEEHGGIDESTGQDIYNANRWRTIGYINVTPNTSYTISSNASSNIWNIFYYYDINKTFIRSQAINGKEVSATTPSNCFYMRCVIGDTNTITTTQRQLEKGATATTYEAYKEQSFDLDLKSKNLFDKDSVVSGFVNADGTVGGDTNAYRTSDFIPIQPNTAYYKTNTASPRTKYFDSNKQPLNTTTYQDISIGGSAGTFTTPNNAYYLRFSYPIASVDADDIQIEQNTSFTEYEPYQEQSFDLDLKSKNLYDIQQYLKQNDRGITPTYNQNSSITLSGTATASYSNFGENVPGVLEKDKTYTLSVTGTKNFSIGCRVSYNDNTYDDFNITSSNTYIKITPTKDVSGFRIYMYSLTSGTSYNATLFFQLEKGSTATEYEPFYDINLCKIDTYKDRIYPLNGKWYLEKNIDKVVLNGSESWSLFAHSDSTDMSQLYTNVTNAYTPTENEEVCIASHFEKGKWNSYWTRGNEVFLGTSGRTGQLWLTPYGYTTASDFKTWLSNNNVIVYYVLATPTTEEITESNYPTLYNQLNNIKLFEGVNHITMTNESGLDVEFDIEYYKDWKLD